MNKTNVKLNLKRNKLEMEARMIVFENLLVTKNSVLTNQDKETLYLIGRLNAVPFR